MLPPPTYCNGSEFPSKNCTDFNPGGHGWVALALRAPQEEAEHCWLLSALSVGVHVGVRVWMVQMSSGLQFSGFDTTRDGWDHGRPDHVLPYRCTATINASAAIIAKCSCLQGLVPLWSCCGRRLTAVSCSAGSEAVDCFEWAVSRPLEHPPGTVGRYRNCDPVM